MGGDGGQVIDRATMVKTKGYGLTKGSGDRYAASLGEMANYVQMVTEDRGLGFLEKRRTRMTQCYISQQTLQEPVVACRLGNFYNKEAVIGALLNKTMPSDITHVRALKDVKLCHITWTEVKEEGENRRRMVCPVAREDLDTGGPRAVLIWSTGTVLSAKTLKEMKLKECPVTGKSFDPTQDIIPLAPDDEELQKLRDRLPAQKKRKAAASEGVAVAPSQSSTTAVTAASASTGGEQEQSSNDTAAHTLFSNMFCATVPADRGGQAPAKKGKLAVSLEGKSDVYKKLIRGSESNGFNGTRDGFGTPAYNRGANIS